MSKLYSKYPAIVIISAFSPYISISLGLKFDSVVIFVFGVLFILYALLLKEDRIKVSLFAMLAAWVSAFVYLLMRTLFVDGIPFSSVAAEIKNFAHPIAIMAVFTFVFSKKFIDSSKDLIKNSCVVLIVLLCLNTLWTFIGFFTDLSAINQWFWRGDESVASRAMTNGRFSGIFNQPMEAGVAYSIGLFAWLYLVENKFMKIRLRSTLMLLLMVAGGLLTVSKVFIFGGLLIFFVGVVVVKEIRKKIIPLSILSFIIGFPVFYFLLNTWEGVSYLFRFFGSNSQQNGLLNMLTAGRYGGESAQQEVFFERIWDAAPVFGEGLGSQEVLDSGFFHFFATGGVIGLLFYIGILATLTYTSIKFILRTNISSESKLFLAIVLLVIIASFGAPVFTLNRSSVIVWVFISVLVNYLSVRIEYNHDIAAIPETSHSTEKKRKRKLKKYRIVW